MIDTRPLRCPACGRQHALADCRDPKSDCPYCGPGHKHPLEWCSEGYSAYLKWRAGGSVGPAPTRKEKP